MYGSYDNSYRSQVTDRKADVEQRLNADEEEAWEGRIHYLDLDLSGATGDLGEALSALGEPTTFGIDRFQRLRQTGSTYTWGTSSTTYDPQHMSHEAWMWHAEHPVEIRRSDPAVEAVDLMFEDQHQGGWGGGFTTAMNATFDLNHDLATYDTLEMFTSTHALNGATVTRPLREAMRDATSGIMRQTSAFVIVITRPNVAEFARGSPPMAEKDVG